MFSSGSRRGVVIGTILALIMCLVGCGLDRLVQLPDDGNAPVSGGTLRLYGGFPPTLDPALAQDSTSAEYIVHLFSGLVRLDASLEVVGDLASDWSLNAAGDVYTFTIRDNARFADGRAIQAVDVVYSWERALSPAMHSPVGSSYLGDIKGASAFARGEAEHIEGLEVVAPNKLRVELTEPRANFVSRLTYPVAFVVDSEQIARDGARWMADPNGSGPFVLEELSLSRIVLARNARYYGAPISLDRAEYVLEGGYPVTLYETGALDVAPVPSDELERLLDSENALSAEMVGFSRLDVQYIGFDVNAPPFDDPLVRQAFTEAIDRERIAEQVLKGAGVAASGVLPPGLADYNADLDAIPYDPVHARQLLRDSEYGGAEGLPAIVLAESGTSGYLGGVTAAVVELLGENLSVEVTVHQVEWSDFLDDLNQQRYQMYVTGWVADYPDSDNFLELLLYSNSAQNHTGYSNTAVDELLDLARLEQNAQERKALYQQAEMIIVQDAPWIPLYHGYEYYLVSPRVMGYHGQSVVYPWLMDIALADAS